MAQPGDADDALGGRAVRGSDAREDALIRVFDGFFDEAWYRARNADIDSASVAPILHFLRHGLAEWRDPNPFFDCAWYAANNPDVDQTGMHPLLHYLQAGAAELRNPHPDFDAAWYVAEHPEAATNPLLYHVRVGRDRGYPTARPFDLTAYLPSQLPAPRVPSRLLVDVIVPVYSGLAETRRCIDSLLADRSRPLGRIIVVEDKSPDAELVAWLLGLARAGAIDLLRNDTNLGFVGSVNHGMRAAGRRDVVLLNSDTEVPTGWLARLAAQAYTAPDIASVSPLSNNATICGWPDDTGGPIAFGLDTGAVDAICRAVNTGRGVVAPTTVGFCMYIRRKALDQVGLFDVARFGAGYGEENDFCLRATAAGWRHRIACDVFVYHKGSVSFGERTRTLSERAMQRLREYYPDYERDVARHVTRGDITPFRFAITAALFRGSGRPVILAITHALGGGVERHIRALAVRLGEQAHFVLLQPGERGAVLSFPALPGHPTLSLPAHQLEALVTLLGTIGITRVHVHHLLGSTLDVRALVHRLNVPFDITVHDYFALCPQINLQHWREGLYCQEPDIGSCNACIAGRPSHAARDILTWRAEYAWLFQDAARVLCPSQDVILRLERHGLGAKAILAPHEPSSTRDWPMRSRRKKGGKLRIAVLGALAAHKGSRTVAAVAQLADPKTMEFHLIGYIDGIFPEPARACIRTTGKYEDAALPRLLEEVDPDLLWFPAAWPETYSYTLSAAIEAGLPIAATAIGAHPERLAGRPLTWLADVATSPPQWIALFEEIRRALRAPASGVPVARPAVADFYATAYLVPDPPPPATPKARRGGAGGARTPSRPRITIVPERFEANFPSPCGYIRLLQPLLHPAITGDADVRVTDANGIFTTDADIVITQRYAIPDRATVDRLAKRVRASGSRLIFDLDDDLLNIPRGHPDARALRPRAAIVARMLDLADAVWVSTQALADQVRNRRPDAMVIENRLDERIWHQAPAPPRDWPLRILCMGTQTHAPDFALIEPALQRLKATFKDRVFIEIAGMTGKDDLPAGFHRSALSIQATRSYPGFVHWLTATEPGWHIGLAPLLDTPFNRCKSAIKTLDYAALGLHVVASDVPVFRGSLADGVAGQLVANTPDAWYAALERLVRVPEERRRRDPRALFLERGTLASQAAMRRAAWQQHLTGGDQYAA